MDDLAVELGATLAYGGIGVLLMAIGYTLVDVATPGSLRQQIWVDRNRNAAVLLASNLVAVGIITVAAIVASHDGLVDGIVSTLVYGLAGLLLMAVAFIVLDLATPGRLGALLVDPEPHPAVWISAVIHLSTGGTIAAAII